MADHSSSSSSLQKKPINTIEHKDTLGNDRDHKEALNSDNDNTSGLKINGVPIEDAREEVLLPGFLSKQYYKLYGLCFVTYLCATMQGYDGALMGSIYTENEYLKYYHLDINSSSGTGLVFSIFNVGQICGAFFVPLMDWKGRKPAILIGCLGVVIGAIISSLTTTKSALIGGRWFLAFFATIANSAAPTYCAEVAPAHLRGKVAGLYNTLWSVGSIVAAFTTYATNKNFPNSSKAFKIPLYLQMMFPGLVCIFGWLIPESPRWLVGVGREEEAREFIIKYHLNGDRTHPLLDMEMAEIIESFHGTDLSNPLEMLDVRILFRTRSDRYRAMLVILMAWFGQFSGNNVCSYYLPTMLRNVGNESVSLNVLMNGVYSIVSWISSICGAFFIDKIGRREGFLGSISGAALALTGLSICTARYEKTKKKSASNGALVFIYLFGVIFSFAFTPMQSMYSTEVSTNLTRSKAQLLNMLVSGVAQFVNQFATPKAMKNIRYWFYVFYVFFDIFEFIVIYFFFVETKGRSLEELEVVFEAPNPRKASVDQAFLAQVRATLVQRNDVRVANAQNLKEQEPLKSDADHVEKLSEAESV